LGASKPIRELRRKAANLIIDRIEHPTPEQGPISKAQAAEDLGISRQAVYDILKRRYCPSLSLVHRACEQWGLQFDFRGMLIEKAAFAVEREEESLRPVADAQLPLDLVEVIQKIDYRSFEVLEAKPVGREVMITIRLTVPA
jgi:DNA-binding XRE family transcriptional regulator